MKDNAGLKQKKMTASLAKMFVCSKRRITATCTVEQSFYVKQQEMQCENKRFLFAVWEKNKMPEVVLKLL